MTGVQTCALPIWLLVRALRLLLLRLLVAALAGRLLVGRLSTALASVGWLRKHILEETSPTALVFLAHGLAVIWLRLVTLRLYFGVARAAKAVIIIHLALAGGGLLHVAVAGLVGTIHAAWSVVRLIGAGGLRIRDGWYGLAAGTVVCVGPCGR